MPRGLWCSKLRKKTHRSVQSTAHHLQTLFTVTPDKLPRLTDIRNSTDKKIVSAAAVSGFSDGRGPLGSSYIYRWATLQDRFINTVWVHLLLQREWSLQISSKVTLNGNLSSAVKRFYPDGSNFFLADNNPEFNRLSASISIEIVQEALSGSGEGLGPYSGINCIFTRSLSIGENLRIVLFQERSRPQLQRTQ